MTLRSYLWGVRFGTLVSAVSWALIVWRLDPEAGGAPAFALFYLSLFVAVSGAATLFLTRVRLIGYEKSEQSLIGIGASFREGLLLGVLAVSLLIFQQYRILIWWDGLLLVAGIFLVELYFLTK